MARKRMIDPEFWSDEEIGSWTHAARLFYIGLWNFADDEGRFKAHPILLKSQIFPYEPQIKIEKLINEVAAKIQWYSIEGSQYGYIRNFNKYQKINRPTESKLPTPPQLSDDSVNTHGGLTPNIREENIREDKRRNESHSCNEPSVIDALNYLNRRAGTNYGPAKKTAELLKARLKDHPLEAIKKVIDVKCAEWLGDEKMQQYLRPATLFGAEKFEQYVGQRVTPEIQKKIDNLKIKEVMDACGA